MRLPHLYLIVPTHERAPGREVRGSDILTAWDAGEAFEGSPYTTGIPVPEGHTTLCFFRTEGVPVLWLLRNRPGTSWGGFPGRPTIEDIRAAQAATN